MTSIGKRASCILSGPIHVPKLVGSDIEWANTIEGIDAIDCCTPAGWELLAELPGLPHKDFRALHDPRLHPHVIQCPNERDLGRAFQRNGGCDYLDSGHAETASPEMLSARRHLAWWIGKQRIIREATIRANRRLQPAGQRLRVAIRNSDRYASWGSHDNFLVARPALERIYKHDATTQWLAAFQVSAICITGSGGIESERGGYPAGYRISQRAAHFTRLRSEETMFERPIINLRDEPHCGPGRQPPYGRMHVIMHDANCSPVSHFLKIGMTQLVLALCEADEVDRRPCCDDVVAAHVTFSRDPSLRVTVPMRDGGNTTIVELQWRFFESVDRFVRAGKCDVPDAEFIVQLWGETLTMLERRDTDRLLGRLDWVHRLAILESALAANSRLSWESPALQLIDSDFGDIENGTFFESQKAGLVEQPVTEEEICAAMHEAPDDTRAWTRTRLLALAPPHMVSHVDWDSVTLRDGDGTMRTIWLSDPLVTKADSPIRDATTFAEALAALGQSAASKSFFQRMPAHTTS